MDKEFVGVPKTGYYCFDGTINDPVNIDEGKENE